MKAKWDDALGVAENLQSRLPDMATKWFAAGEAAMQQGVSWEAMHNFRLLTKRFRYTLEIFQPLYGPSLEARIGLLRKLQTYLGEINDCVTAEQYVGSEPGAESIVSGLRTRAERKRGELKRFWTQKFGGPGPLAEWTRYLSRYAGKGGNGRKLIGQGSVR